MAPATGYTPLSVLEDSPGSSLPPSHLKFAYGLRKRELVIGDVFQQIHKIFRKTRVIVDQNSFHVYLQPTSRFALDILRGRRISQTSCQLDFQSSPGNRPRGNRAPQESGVRLRAPEAAESPRHIV